MVSVSDLVQREGKCVGVGKSSAEIEAWIDKALLQCSLAANGLWRVMRYRIDYESDRRGHLRWDGRPYSLSQLARVAGCDPDEAARLLSELVSSGVVAGADGAYHAPKLTRLATIQEKGADRTRRWREARQSAGASRDASRAPRVTRAVTQPVTRARAQPPPSPSPAPPPPTPPDLLGAGAPEAAAPPPPTAPPPPPTAPPPASAGKSAGKSKAGKRRKRTDAEHAERRAFIAWFTTECWPAYFAGELYDFESDDPHKRRANHEAAWNILDELGWRLDHAKQAAEFFARQRSAFHYRDHIPLARLAKVGKPREYLAHAQMAESAGQLRIGTERSNDDVSTAAGSGHGGGGGHHAVVDDYAIPVFRPGAATGDRPPAAAAG